MLSSMQELRGGAAMPSPIAPGTGVVPPLQAEADTRQDMAFHNPLRKMEAYSVAAQLPPPTITAIIPTKNEGDILIEVAESVKKYCDEVIIVDGHSTDGSAALARQRGFTVLTDHGLGKGDAVRCGVMAATSDIVVIMDADGSHDPDDIPALVAPILQAKADLVIGCRMTGGSDEFAGTWELFIRLWGNNFLTMLCNTRFAVALTDSQNGFRAARLQMLRELDLQENKHTIELEIVLKTLKKRYKVCQVPTHEYGRRLGLSSLSVRKQLPHFLGCLLKHIW
jgi:dolichol-phosphate mannosyltransferase